MNISEKDYNELALLWGVFQYMTNPLVNVSDTIVEGFLREFGMLTKEGRYVANKEGVDLKGYA